MAHVIACIPADTLGNKLWLTDFREEGEKLMVKYKSTYSDLPFMDTELTLVDGGKNAAITGHDGTILYRFGLWWLNMFIEE